MLSQMMSKSLAVSSLIEHAERFHGTTTIVSVETMGEIDRSTWRDVGCNARKLASALRKIGLIAAERLR
jgi:long-subunit acyl-CoA synthetase (AMP-forming)